MPPRQRESTAFVDVDAGADRLQDWVAIVRSVGCHPSAVLLAAQPAALLLYP